MHAGRIYDSETGTSCHQVRVLAVCCCCSPGRLSHAAVLRLQCRQKTVEVKAKCTRCTLYWCPRCLSNRYGEVVEQVSVVQKLGSGFSTTRGFSSCGCRWLPSQIGAAQGAGACATAATAARYVSTLSMPQWARLLDRPRQEACVPGCRSRGWRPQASWQTSASAQGWSLCAPCWMAAARH